jgi:hypothetical protein
MRKLFLSLLFSASFALSNAQSPADSVMVDSVNIATDTSLLLGDMMLDETPPLLPERMIFTQRWIYGEKGLLRATGLVPLTLANREKEMKVRRAMLVSHQLVGYGALAAMLGTATTGILLYNHITNNKGLHEGFVVATNAGYIAGAALALLAPPPLLSYSGGKWSSIDWHKMFAVMHITGMITTNILSGPAAKEKGNWKLAHGIAGGFTALTFTAGFVSIKF